MEKNKTELNTYVNNNYDQAGMENLTKFFGYNPNVYLDPGMSGFGIVFVTKPSLFIYPTKPSENISDNSKAIAYSNMCADSKFSYFITGENNNAKDQLLVKQLSYFNFPEVSSLFIPIFTNLAKSFTPADVNLDVVDRYSTRDGYRFTMPTNTVVSESAATLSFSVTETDNLDFMKILTLWVNYIKNITNGTFAVNTEMVKQNMLDYTSSIYYFLLGADGRTIKYWCRYTGCYPTTIPYSALNYSKASINQIELDITFQYMFKEEMDPRLLEDFNIVSLGLVSPELFNNIDYDAYISNIDNDNVNGYSSFTNSPLLNQDVLSSGTRSEAVRDSARDPLVFYESIKTSDVVSQNMTQGYVLSFGDDSLKNKLFNTLIDNEDAFTYDSLSDNDRGDLNGR